MRLQRMTLLLIAVFVLLLVGMPYYGISVQVRIVTHALLTVAMAGWLITRIWRGRFLPRTPLNGPLLAGAGVLALSTVFALDPRMAAEHAWWPLVHALIFCFFAAQIQRGRQRLLFELLFFLGAVSVLLAGVNFLMWAGQISAAVDVGAWLSGAAEFPPITPMLSMPMHASTALAGFVVPQIVVAFGWAGTARRRDERIALVLLGIGLTLALLGTGSRGGFLSLAAAVIALLILRIAPRLWETARSGHGWRRVLVSGAAVVAIAALAIGLVLYISRSGARTSGDEIRTSLWSRAAEAAQDSPALGVGPGGYGRVMRAYFQPGEPADFRHRQAHNIVLNTAAEEGIAGLLILGWMAVALLRAWFRQRRAAAGRRALRLEVVLAALVAVALQAQFDVFFTTPFVALVALLAAYAVTPPDQSPAPGRVSKIAAWAALGLVLAYGLAFIPSFSATLLFERSVQDEDVSAAEQAAVLDPGLRLYPLQVAYLNGMAAMDNPAQRPAAISGLESALATEPTWDTGWILLAGLYEQDGRIPGALAALERAQAIQPGNAAAWNWARIADAHDAAPDAAIVQAYASAMGQTFTPYSPEWTATPRRLEALEQIYASANPRLQFRLAETFFPDRVTGLVPADPQTADDWWRVGEYALTVGNDAQAAWAAFDQAVQVNPNREIGEYYAARARAGAALGPDGAAQARRDAAMAKLLVLTAESEPEPYPVSRDFEDVLYNRWGTFALPAALIPPQP
jgi:O-antigen ligase